MKKYSLIFILIATLGSMMSCTKKDTNIDFFEVKCRNMKIKTPYAQMLGDSTWQSDTTCGDIPYMGTAEISFDVKADMGCFFKIAQEDVSFYSGLTKLDAVSHTGSLLKTDPKVRIEGNKVTYTFCFLMKSQDDWKALDYITVKWHIENEIADWSNSLTVRINMPGKGPDPSTYDVKETVKVYTKFITVKLWDHASQDGDIVSVALNNQWVLNNHYLTKKGHTFPFTINPGTNHLVVYAENQGSSGPNTCSISINGGKRIELSPDMLTGEAVNIEF